MKFLNDQEDVLCLAVVIVSAIVIVLGVIWGVIALINAREIDKLQDMGDFESARAKAKMCRIMWVVAVVVNVLMVMGTIAQNS